MNNVTEEKIFKTCTFLIPSEASYFEENKFNAFVFIKTKLFRFHSAFLGIPSFTQIPKGN